MYYGDDILFLENGLRIGSKTLHPIGITDRSQCWGIEIVSDPQKKTPPHLLVSAFSPQNWHILFCVEIELWDAVGTMSKASQVFEQCDFNILSTQCAPSGHNHATWRVIGEALKKKEQADKALEESIQYFKPNYSAFQQENDEFREKLTETFSVPLLRYSRDLEKIFERANELFPKEERFLHKRFVEHNTLLYKSLSKYFTAEPELYTRISEHELHRAVESRWLQQMAVFRSYSQAKQKEEADKKIKSYASWDSPILFKYDAKKSLLEPLTQDDKQKYIQLIETCAAKKDLPIKAIAAFNHEEHYLRIVLPEPEKRERRISIQLDYSANFDGDSQKSSKGLLKEITGILEKYKVNMNYVSNTMSILTSNREEGSISIIGTPDENIRDEFIGKLKSGLESIDERKGNVSFSKTSVNKVGAKSVFISTKFGFMNLKSDLRDAINELSKHYGLEPVWGDPQKDKDPTEKELQDLTDIITGRLLKSHAFLQIIPEMPKKPMQQNWLLFEFGIATGAQLPCAICVDERKVKHYPPSVAADRVKYTFDGRRDTKDICKEIEPAIKYLAQEVYDSEK